MGHCQNTILSHKCNIKLSPPYSIKKTNLFHCPLLKVQSYPIGISPLNMFSVQIHVIFLQSFS